MRPVINLIDLVFVLAFVSGISALAPSAQTAPTADAGTDQAVAESATVTLDGSGSAADGR